MSDNSTAARRPADVVREHLARYLGPFTSKNAIQLMAKQALSTDPDHITPEQVPTLIEALGPTLRTLLGKAGAQTVIEQIRTDLGLPNQDRGTGA